MKCLKQYLQKVGLFTILILMVPWPLMAQVEMSITGELTLRPTDADATSYFRQTDSDDKVCAIIKVKPSHPMGAVLVLQTGGSIAPVPPPKGMSNKQLNGSWWYWLSPMTRNIFFTAEGYTETAPLGVRLEAGKVYELKLTVGAAKKSIDTFSLDETVLKLNITPEDCVVSYGKDDKFDMGTSKVNDGYFDEVLAFGTYKVKVENPYYETHIETYNVDAETEEDVISLRPLYGFLCFESQPAGADVYMDGSVEPIGKTPFTSGKILRGMHSFRVSKENYYDYQIEHEVYPDGNKQSVPLVELSPQFGIVTCVCDDADATLIVTDTAGRVVGQGKSGMRLELGSEGNYKLEASKSSHSSLSVEIQGGAGLEGQDLTVNIGAPEPIYGRLSITSEPMLAEVWIDGERAGDTPWEDNLLIGKHQIELKCEWHLLEPFTVNIVENENLSVSKTMIDGLGPGSFGAESANCYIVSKPGTYFFYTVKGNSAESVGPVASAEVLWESFGTSKRPSKGDIIEEVSYTAAPDGLKGDGGIISFSTPATLKDGNAVIAAKDVNGTILWSWHIWVCSEYNPVSTAQVYFNNAGTMMDRNLGAVSAMPGTVGSLGLFYQWGRKDPFLSKGGMSSDKRARCTLNSWPSPVSLTDRTGTVEFAIAHPTTFVYCPVGPEYDWICSSPNNTLWQSSKTIYDPCPPGWKIPEGGPDGVWAKALGSNDSFYGYGCGDTMRGMNFSGKFGSDSTIWYPSPGLLDGAYCYLYLIFGLWWSCTPHNDKIHCLTFASDGFVYPSNDGPRASGLSVRCIQE
ncbi:MAG: PEGA domain-containing protein [Bacteroidales bacterium]|nr:PEGA domain-containing protein [Bacteroidales bacterium]